jgi:glycosyltransferase involved in cell wall biosynthesis
VAISQAVQAELKRPSHLIYQGFPLPPLPDDERQFDVAILGRIHPVKQHGLFLQACHKLYQERGQLAVLLIGGHPQAGSYQAQIDAEVARLRQMGLHIHVTGDVPATAVFDWLAQTKLLIVTSASEGFGRMAVEALACGVPVIANPVGGLREIIRPGENGFLAQENDAASFAELAGRLLADELLCHRLGQQGRQMAESRFSLAAMVTAYETLYRQVAQGNG